MPFATPLLDRALARRKQQNEQRRLAVMERVWVWLEQSGSQYGIEQAYVFGSVICPYRFTERSDVDLAVETMQPDDFFAAMAKLSEWVERPVDLVELSKCPFADRIRQQGLLWTRQI